MGDSGRLKLPRPIRHRDRARRGPAPQCCVCGARVTSFFRPRPMREISEDCLSCDAEAAGCACLFAPRAGLAWTWRRSEEHTSELQSLMRISYAVFCLKKK